MLYTAVLLCALFGCDKACYILYATGKAEEMSVLNEQELKAQIKSSEFSPAYLIYGEENYLKEHYISLLKKKLVDPAFESFNFHRFEGADIDLDDVFKDAQMLPMMSEYNFVLVRDYPVEKSKNDIKLLEEYLTDAPESTVLVFLYSSLTPDAKSASFKKLIKAFDKSGAVINLEKRNESEVAKLLVAGAKKRGSSISVDNAKYLVSVCGNDMVVLLNELDKLSSFAHSSEITRDIIDNMATKCLQARVYDLSKAIVAGNADSAFGVLNTLFAMKEEPVIILSVIGGVFVDMYRVKCAKTAGMVYDDVAKYYNYRGREFALRNATRDCARLTEKQLRNAIDEITEADIKIKSTATDKRLILEELVAKLFLIMKGVSYAQG